VKCSSEVLFVGVLEVYMSCGCAVYLSSPPGYIR
jgi:hypothetical protein